ncbi:hypothetical protein BN2475_1380005 [Paraburkholderia ribeironis]|uniref:Uncharacterized protein n=1 Tax=Paraburkholderia ribeironis TaxID=1247936 RepID=A0A1N7SPK7_9BURK|nr:hypothetical protein BN2475_1380005 [Paraburkholderia ribeironis]
MRRSGYAKMSFQAEHGTVEGHEPIETHLRVESSPLPTPLKRQDADRRRSQVWTGAANAGWRCMPARWNHGERAARP